MSKKSWVELLEETVTGLQKRLRTSLPDEPQAAEEQPLQVAVVGIGHELRGDDAAGLVAAQRLRPFAHEHLLVIEGRHAPENHTGRIRRFDPDLVILVDSAQLEEPPGTIRWLPWPETTGLSASSHTMPPYMLARFLTAELKCEVALIGIQPANTSLDSPLSRPVERAVSLIVSAVKSNLT